MNKIRKIIMLLTFAAILFSPFQNVQAYDGKGEYIRVSGTAEYECAPDTAYVYFSVLGRGRTSEEAVGSAAGKAAAVKRSLLGSDIPPDAFATENYSLSPVYSDKYKLMSYEANNMLKVRVDDLEKLGIVIDKLSEAGVDIVSHISFDLRDRSRYEQQLIGEALKESQRKADIVAAAGGRRLGRLLSADLLKNDNWNVLQYDMQGVRSNKIEDAVPTVIKTKKIIIRAELNAVFAME